MQHAGNRGSWGERGGQQRESMGTLFSAQFSVRLKPL